jgi:hypothetical protein
VNEIRPDSNLALGVVKVPHRLGTPARIFSALTLAGALAGSGCVSADLTKGADVRREVAECLPEGTQAPSLVLRAIWFPSTNGFRSPDAAPFGRVSGVLALAGDMLWFMNWNETEHHYDMTHSVSFMPPATLRIDRFGTASMLVIQSGNMAYDSFELMNGGDLGSDPKATQELYDNLQARRARAPGEP